MKGLCAAILTAVCLLQQSAAPPLAASESSTVAFAGVVHPSRIVEVATPVEGIVESVEVDRGDVVAPGQVLARLDLAVQKASFDVAKAKAENLAALRVAQAQLEDARRKLTQNRKLHEKGVLSRDVLEQLQADHQLAVLELERVKEQQRIARLEQDRLRVTLEQGVIKSSVAGIVTERFLHPGELASRAGKSVFFKVVSLDPLHVETHVPVAHLGDIQVGERLSVEIDAREKVVRDATVVVIDPVIDTASDTFGVRLELPNTDHLLPAGLSCRVLLRP